MTLSNNTQVFFFAKLSLDLNLGYHDRTIPATEAIRSVGTSIYAQRMSPKLSPGFKFIPEVIGIFPKGWTRGGQIIRPVPAEILKGKVKVLPLFALTKLENGTTLLEQMAKISGDAAPDFARTAILAPFVKAWVSWAMDGGITMEAHGQNVLFSVNQLGLPTGEFYQRDMGGTTIDFDSKAFPKEMRMEFPHFSEFGTYYELSQKSKRIQTSLGVYFQDRVLNNIDRELQRVAPGYVPGQIISQLWIELQNEIIRHTGIDRNQIPIEKLKTDLGTILRNGARRTSNRPVFSAPSTKSCESIF
ncbi:MAG: hypothetical protein H7326_10190 [Bdellovibrionaceae bacterium]|nr:hypothetical protein [Pseudobdellovibrionaceae bacterium]